MAGVVTPLTQPQRWKTRRQLIGATAVEITTPAEFKVGEQVTLMIQAINGNVGTVYVSSESTVDNLGTDAGFELQPGEAVVLPAGDVARSEVWLSGTNAADTVNLSFFGGEILC